MDAISISGLQGTGKTTLARALGSALGAVVLSRGALMDVLIASGVPAQSGDFEIKTVGDMAYDLQTALLREQLSMGFSVILDCAAGKGIRETWRTVASQAGASFWLIDTVCSNVELHRQRFQSREPSYRCDVGQTWDMVNQRRSDHSSLPEVAYTADAVLPVDENVAEIVGLIRGRQ